MLQSLLLLNEQFCCTMSLELMKNSLTCKPRKEVEGDSWGYFIAILKKIAIKKIATSLLLYNARWVWTLQFYFEVGDMSIGATLLAALFILLPLTIICIFEWLLLSLCLSTYCRIVTFYKLLLKSTCRCSSWWWYFTNALEWFNQQFGRRN